MTVHLFRNYDYGDTAFIGGIEPCGEDAAWVGLRGSSLPVCCNT
jgi:hypothetical protein